MGQERSVKKIVPALPSFEKQLKSDTFLQFSRKLYPNFSSDFSSAMDLHPTPFPGLVCLFVLLAFSIISLMLTVSVHVCECHLEQFFS